MQITRGLISIFLLIIILIHTTTCKSEQTEVKIDTVTSATPKYIHSKLINIPPPSTTYEVLGVKKGVKNFVVKYDSNLYRGGELYSPDGIKSLRSIGIRTIVSITPSNTERNLVEKQNITLIEIPFDRKSGLSPENLQKFLSLFSKENIPIYVHCHGGTHRGGALGIAYRVYKCGWSWNEALLEYVNLGGNSKTGHRMFKSITNISK